MGILPHQIRGFLSTFSNVVVHGRPFKHCTACSAAVRGGRREEERINVRQILNEHARRGNEFLLRAFNEPNFLEVTSLRASSSPHVAADCLGAHGNVEGGRSADGGLGGRRSRRGVRVLKFVSRHSHQIANPNPSSLIDAITWNAASSSCSCTCPACFRSAKRLPACWIKVGSALAAGGAFDGLLTGRKMVLVTRKRTGLPRAGSSMASPCSLFQTHS
eukprot:768744-Hanusia_phi.AAC.4